MSWTRSAHGVGKNAQHIRYLFRNIIHSHVVLKFFRVINLTFRTKAFWTIMSFFTESPSWSPMASACMAAAGGVASHVFVFRHGDYHLKVPQLLRLFLATSFSIFLCALKMDSINGICWIQRAATNTIYIIMIYLVFLTASIVVYRTMFHQLHDFPGPFMARVTKLWHFGKGLNTSNHSLLDQLHKQYGDFVRTGKCLASFHGDVCQKPT